jgi:acetolactate synthase-1/3 small subunit
VNVGESVIIAMVADEPKRIDNYLKAIKRYNPKEIVRSGAVALER